MKTKKELKATISASKVDLQNILNELRCIESLHNENSSNIAKLTSMGCKDFKEYWNGKYMYMLGAMVEGKRSKEYVGCKPEKIAEARKKKENFDKRADLIEKNEALEARLSTIQFNIYRALGNYNLY